MAIGSSISSVETLKFVLVGPPDIGKSNLMLAYGDGYFTLRDGTTIAIKKINNNLKVQIWDTGGFDTRCTECLLSM